MRLACLAYLMAVALCCVMVFYSAILRRMDFFAGAVVLGAVAWVVRTFLHGHVTDLDAEVSDLDESEVTAFESDDAGRVGGLVKLLHEWDGLERARGSSGFDPWALQSLRNEIRIAVRDDPSLERLFRNRG